MTSDTSPLRRTLCSRDNALRVARRMTDDGIPTVVVASNEPLQPWCIVEFDAADHPEIRACA
ncbi:hypothetical protein [Sphingomonas solaris]|nr:hypothetical protein [Sphingomonas solaris]